MTNARQNGHQINNALFAGYLEQALDFLSSFSFSCTNWRNFSCATCLSDTCQGTIKICRSPSMRIFAEYSRAVIRLPLRHRFGR
jgi:hypothetical protein